MNDANRRMQDREEEIVESYRRKRSQVQNTGGFAQKKRKTDGKITVQSTNKPDMIGSDADTVEPQADPIRKWQTGTGLDIDEIMPATAIDETTRSVGNSDVIGESVDVVQEVEAEVAERDRRKLTNYTHKRRTMEKDEDTDEYRRRNGYHNSQKRRMGSDCEGDHIDDGLLSASDGEYDILEGYGMAGRMRRSQKKKRNDVIVLGRNTEEEEKTDGRRDMKMKEKEGKDGRRGGEEETADRRKDGAMEEKTSTKEAQRKRGKRLRDVVMESEGSDGGKEGCTWEESEEERSDEDEAGCGEEEEPSDVTKAYKGRKRRGRPRGTTNAKKRATQKETRSQKHFKPTEVLALAQAWMKVSQTDITTEDSMWKSIAQICKDRFNMTRSANSLRAKWSTFQRDAFYWISCKSRVQREQTTGNWSEEKIVMMTHRLFTGDGSDGKKTGRKRFKYVEAAEYLSKYPKFMNIDDEGTKTGDDVDVRRKNNTDGKHVRRREGPHAEEVRRVIHAQEDDVNTEQQCASTGVREEVGEKDNEGEGDVRTRRIVESCVQGSVERTHVRAMEEEEDEITPVGGEGSVERVNVVSTQEDDDDIRPIGGQRREGRVRGLGTKAQKDIQRRKKQDEFTKATMEPINARMTQTSDTFHKYVASQQAQSIDEKKYMYLQGLYMTLEVMSANDPARPALIQKMVAANLDEATPRVEAPCTETVGNSGSRREAWKAKEEVLNRGSSVAVEVIEIDDDQPAGKGVVRVKKEEWRDDGKVEAKRKDPVSYEVQGQRGIELEQTTGEAKTEPTEVCVHDVYGSTGATGRGTVGRSDAKGNMVELIVIDDSSDDEKPSGKPGRAQDMLWKTAESATPRGRTGVMGMKTSDGGRGTESNRIQERTLHEARASTYDRHSDGADHINMVMNPIKPTERGRTEVEGTIGEKEEGPTEVHVGVGADRSVRTSRGRHNIPMEKEGSIEKGDGVRTEDGGWTPNKTEPTVKEGQGKRSLEEKEPTGKGMHATWATQTTLPTVKEWRAAGLTEQMEPTGKGTYATWATETTEPTGTEAHGTRATKSTAPTVNEMRATRSDHAAHGRKRLMRKWSATQVRRS